MSAIQPDLLEFVSKSFLIEPEEIPLDRSLIDEGIIDSFGLVEITSYLEKKYAIKVTEEDLTRENFGSILKIVAFVEQKMTSRTN